MEAIVIFIFYWPLYSLVIIHKIKKPSTRITSSLTEIRNGYTLIKTYDYH